MVIYRVVCHGEACYSIEASEEDEVAATADFESIDELEVTKLALLCNQLQLSPIHLKDVAEDVMYQISQRKVE